MRVRVRVTKVYALDVPVEHERSPIQWALKLPHKEVLRGELSRVMTECAELETSQGIIVALAKVLRCDKDEEAIEEALQTKYSDGYTIQISETWAKITYSRFGRMVDSKTIRWNGEGAEFITQYRDAMRRLKIVASGRSEDEEECVIERIPEEEDQD